LAFNYLTKYDVTTGGRSMVFSC